MLTTAIVFALAGLIGQLFIYGLSTWLPEIMRSAGYPLGSALSFLATMSIGAIAGATVMSICADRIGPRTVAIWGFGIGVLSLVTMSLAPADTGAVRRRRAGGRGRQRHRRHPERLHRHVVPPPPSGRPRSGRS
ncbi:hypothetical protein [Prauserella rugosa]|uniref:hypothetical protein n=1 Tax=Prauserella rugosa TaxID=43354 RepID=UPI002482FD5F|nr:hypothetical protein [Prauserella rugosa]